ncbi:unnamed protein product [Sphagnum tenellum]
MAATVVPSTSFTSSLRRSSHFGRGLQSLHAASLRVPGVSLRAMPSVCSKLTTSSSSTSTEEPVAVGGSLLAGAMFAAMMMPDSAMASQQLMALAADDNRGIALLLPLVPAIGWVLFNILQPGLNQFNKMRGVKAVVAGAGLGALATMMVAPHASAAQEIATVADSDSRGLLLLGILVPAVAWVLYNILQPALNQLDKLRSSKGVVGALGLGAVSSMYLTPQAEAVQEITQLAADNRPLILLFILLPAVGWVLFNILQPALNQLNKMRIGK